MPTPLITKARNGDYPLMWNGILSGLAVSEVAA
jgi:hypothetical protein